MLEPHGRFGETLLDASRHDRGRFACGKEQLDQYIRTQASQDVKRGLAVVHVVFPVDEPSRIAGYYTLSSMSIELTELPPAMAKRVPYGSVPAFLIGRLAVDSEYQGTGLGRTLLKAALQKCLDVAMKYVAGRVIVVDAIDEAAASFYAKYGFWPLEAAAEYPQRLGLLTGSLTMTKRG